MHDSPKTAIEQLEERFHLDRLKDEFNDAQKDYDDLLEFEEERESKLCIDGSICRIWSSLNVESEFVNVSRQWKENLDGHRL